MKLRTLLATTALVLACASLPAVPTQATRPIPGDSIVLGTVYNVFHEEYATDAEFFRQVDQDIPAIKAAGMDTLMVFPLGEWNVETRTRQWTRTDYLIRAIEKAGLKFVPLMLKEEQCSHYFPIWKFDEFPDLAAKHRSRGRNSRENVDFADPRIMPLVVDYFREVVERYGKSPALSFYNVWNEPHYSSDAPHVVDRFRSWLQKKYGDLASLRRAWGDDYTAWEQVSPALNDDWNSSLPYMDWTAFRADLTGEILVELTQSLRALDPVHPINANPVGTFVGSQGEIGGYTQDNWALTAGNDFNGASYYPDGWDRDRSPEKAPVWWHNFNFNAFHSAAGEKDYLLTEIFTHAKTGLTLGGYMDYARTRQIAWLALANNCKGMLYWKWEPFFRGRQSLGRGLVEVDGTLSPRGEALRDLGTLLQTHGRLLRSARPEAAQVGILFDRDSLLKTQEPGTDPRLRQFAHESVLGTFRALDEGNVPADILRPDRGLDAATLARYRVLILPFQVVLRRSLAPLLEAYVEQGGTLIADARTATVDELDTAYRVSPGLALSRVFGATRRTWVAENTTWALSLGENYKGAAGHYFRETLIPAEGAKVIGTFADGGSPALIENHFGRGTAYLAGFSWGGSLHKGGQGPLADLLNVLVIGAGVEPAFSVVGRESLHTSVRVHQTEKGYLIYLINRTEETVRGHVTPREGQWSIQEITTTNGPVHLTAQGALPYSLPAHGVSVYLATPQ